VSGFGNLFYEFMKTFISKFYIYNSVVIIMPKNKEVQEAIQKLAKYEGFTIEEAMTTYEARKKFPSDSFCGPYRSFLAHTADHVREAFQRLAQFGHRIKPELRKRILEGLKRKAKRHRVSHEETIQNAIRIMETPEEQIKKTIQWWMKKEGLIE